MRNTVSVFLGLALAFLFGTAGVCVAVPDGGTAAPEGDAAARVPVKPAYELEIDLSWDQRTLDAREVVTAVNSTGTRWDRLVFSVPPAANSDGFVLHSVTVAQGHATIQVVPEFHSSMLYIKAPQSVPDGGTVVIELNFKLTLKKLGAYTIHPAGNQGYNGKVIQCGDFFPTLTPYDPQRGFREWEYAAVGDPYIYPLADYSVRLRTRPDVTVAAAGLVSQDKGEWRFVLQDARSFAFTASPFYRREERTLDSGVRISSYFLTGYERAGRAMLEAAAQSVDLFSDLYGPYPYKELVLAHNAYNSAMEYSGFITVTDTYIRNFSPSQPQLLLFIVAHETSHQWWYGAVGSDQVNAPWLDESLAKYSEYLYFRAYYPALEQWWLRRLASVPRLKNHFVDDTMYDFHGDLLAYSRVIYGMAPAFIRKLHLLLGEETFFAFLKDYYASGRGRFVTAADFFRVLSRHTDKDITPLLKEFFRHPPNMAGSDPGE